MQSTGKAAVSKVSIGSEQAGQRLDNFLFRMLKGVPKSRIYRMLREGELRVSGRRSKPEYKLVEGDEVRIPPVRVAEARFQDVLHGTRRQVDDVDRPRLGRCEQGAARRVERQHPVDPQAAAEDAALCFGDRVISASTEVVTQASESLQIHSNGFRGERRTTSFHLSASVTARDGEERRRRRS